MARLKYDDPLWYIDGVGTVVECRFIRRDGRYAVVGQNTTYYPFGARSRHLHREILYRNKADAENLARLVRHWMHNPEALPQDEEIANAN